MQQPKPFSSWIYLVAAALSFPMLGAEGGCGGSTVTPPETDAATTSDASPGDVGPAIDVGSANDAGPAVDTGAGCPLPGGGFCAAGASCPAGDGCNTCSCTAGGRLACTERACAIDAGPAPDTQAGCTLPNGTFCAAGATCPAGDGCNDCSCTASGAAVCTARPCAIDAGAPDRVCVIDCAAPPPGCHYEGVTSCDPPSCGTLVCADAGSEVTCGESFPTFDRHCATNADCFVATHQTDCCGDSRAMGLNVSEREAFAHAEGICQPMYPHCGCATHPPVLDDGTSATFDATIPVECRAGACTTYQRP